MAKKMNSFRLSAETLEMLEQITEKTKMDKTLSIEKALELYHFWIFTPERSKYNKEGCINGKTMGDLGGNEQKSP